jgi:hypothetical protein
MGSDANVANGQRPTSEGLYFLGKGGILPITNQCNPVLNVRHMSVICFDDLMCVA